MYHLFKDDPWGNKVPYLSVSDPDMATEILKKGKNFITKVVEVPPSKSTIIMM